jgi:hypothetical protein
MGLLTRASDTIYTFRFLRLLTTPWVKTGAYKLGIIDDKGNVIKKPETDEEKSKYNLFHRLVFNIKRLLNKLPLGKTTIASYLTALYLLKEKYGFSDRALSKILKETTGVDPRLLELEKNNWYLAEDNKLVGGNYNLVRDIALPSTGEVYALKNSVVTIDENCIIRGNILGVNVYEAFHHKTRQKILVTQYDIIK